MRTWRELERNNKDRVIKCRQRLQKELLAISSLHEMSSPYEAVHNKVGPFSRLRV